VRDNDPQGEIEELARRRLFDDNTIEAPAIFNMLMRELGEVKTYKRLIDVVREVRSWRETASYRDWLWEYYQAADEGNQVAQQKMLDKLGSHLSGMRKVGDPRSIRTAALRFSVSRFISFPIELAVPRWDPQNFVGFIGEWFAPTQRPRAAIRLSTIISPIQHDTAEVPKKGDE
jgi:hypothetical protein